MTLRNTLERHKDRMANLTSTESPRRKPVKAPWVNAHGTKPGEVGTCTRCGAVLKLKMPMNLTAFCKYLDAFVEEHLYCKEKVDGQEKS